MYTLHALNLGKGAVREEKAVVRESGAILVEELELIVLTIAVRKQLCTQNILSIISRQAQFK